MNRSGRLTALAPGTAVITARTGAYSASVTVTVLSLLDHFDLPDEYWLITKKTVQFTDCVQPRDAEVDLTWTSDNTPAAVVDANGVITGWRPNDVTIRVRDANTGIEHAILVHVCYPVTAIELDPVEAELPDGYQRGTVVTESLQPISLLLK